MFQINFTLIFQIIITIVILPSKTLTIDPEYELINRLNTAIQLSMNALFDIFNMNEDGIPKKEYVTIWCVNPDNPIKEYHQVYAAYDPYINRKINLKKSITFLIHGWTDNFQRTWITNIVNDFIKFTKSNICVVNWERLALTDYRISVENIKIVANEINGFINYLIQVYGVKLTNITLIGHSLGAQISGLIGKHFNGQISRIIGLDPAGPLFTRNPLTLREHINKNNAQFVQILHTDHNILGTDLNCGHQDYYANGGHSPQPGCVSPALENGMTYSTIVCSHYKSVEYFRYSLNPNNKFIGQECRNYTEWLERKCDKNRSANFGIYARKENASGSLYLKTNIWPPYV